MVARDDDCGYVRSLVLARRPGDNRQAIELRLLPGHYNVLARPVVDELRLARMAQGVGNLVIDLMDFALEREGNAFR